MKVLVFETSKDRAKLISDLLDDYRYKIHINYQGNEVLNDLREIKPSLVIVNANVRPDSGVSILEKIKTDPRYSKIPVILISNFTSTELPAEIKKYTNVDYLVEPFKIKNFRHIVERWINFRSLYVN
ncbi:MAG: response regulator [Calditrichaeota bacterium]|nr:response regulator [Calditrichota bacterium]MCB0292440.1 response regulator [Calditrichota bacterium]MCB0302400.1 response regulator [Calditrichota bacterium]MCB0312998.1 response regulator [Calditrichota bacterium]MCB9090776.1 response regulator [Calditrichia bacterium]